MKSRSDRSARLVACADTPLSRRRWLGQMGAGFGTLGLATVLADAGLLGGGPARASSDAAGPLAPKSPHWAPRAKHVIFLFMNGGPSHVDTFDPKPALEKYAGQQPESLTDASQRKVGKLFPSPFKFARYGENGVDVSELYPHLAKAVDEICVIRSMYTDIPNHEPALLMMNSGNTQPTRPSLGSWLTYGLGTDNQSLPGFVVLCPGKPTVGPQLWGNSFLPGVFQGCHINNGKIDPKSVIEHVHNAWLAPDAQRRQLDLIERLNREHLNERGADGQLEARIESLEMAFRLQFAAQETFDLNRETAATRAAYGAGEFADACLVARRLVERGVRMVQIYFGGGQPWDDHGDIMNHAKHAQASDRPIAALIDDLKRRGLLDETLIVWGGEFGRTPWSEGAKGRDHHARGFTCWLAGGGVKGGLAYGQTDEFGNNAVTHKVHVHDLHATILHLLGIDHERLTYRYSGRDFRLTDVSGQVVRDILA
ncbi:MAG TPA: DUF1501 domain-containing protein [Pirellulales bacterium]|nr:DUF1501 domain-containing protein [Pirellulales bacterium]